MDESLSLATRLKNTPLTQPTQTKVEGRNKIIHKKMPTQTKVVLKLTNSDNIIVEEKQHLKVMDENSLV